MISPDAQSRTIENLLGREPLTHLGCKPNAEIRDDPLLAVQPAEGRPLGLQPVAVAADPQPSLSL